jgi:hypothetical protein
VWSLGCTLSVAATYLVLGTQGVNLYKSIRIKASKNGDAFHDGTVVLQIVTKWHRYLRASRRHADVFTHAILDVVDEDMLIPEKERKSAETVANRFREILENTPIPDEDFSDVQAFLQEIDKEEELRKERLASLPPQSTNLPIENQPQPPTITVIGESKEQTSEEKLRSQPLQLTAKRQPIRRLSARQTDLRIRPIRKIFSDPVSRVIWTDEGRRTKAKLGLDTTTSLQDLPHGHGISLASLPPQNIFQLNEQLSTIGLEWNLPWKTAGSGAGIRGGMKRMMKKQQVPVKGKMKDDPLELLFRGRDIVSRSETANPPSHPLLTNTIF